MTPSTIEWTDMVWNPVSGCTKVSTGCKLCYAEAMFKRFGKYWGHDFNDVRLMDKKLNDPKRVKESKKVFVNSMSDLFHEDVPFPFIAKVFRTMIECPHHTFQVLTKRPERMLKFFDQIIFGTAIINLLDPSFKTVDHPFKNIWLGVSCENQETADERIPLLLQVPAAVRFVSCEPLLGPIDLSKTWNQDYPMEKIHWIICGGETGWKARPMHPDWVRSIRNQCLVGRVPFFFKQWGEWIDNQNFPQDYNRVDQHLIKHTFSSGYTSTDMWRIGRSKSGSTLDGKQHMEFPITSNSVAV